MGNGVNDPTPYNPLDMKNLGASIAEALLGRKLSPLGELKIFRGAGIYAIYYNGDLKPYELLAARNREDRFEAPIYVGKAVPKGARKGLRENLSGTSSRALFDRLVEHAESIRANERQAEGIAAKTHLRIDDFFCRYLVVEDIWIPLGESLLIAKFAPIWNHLVDGFGNHDPGAGRHQGKRPLWDVLHPGRVWALRCAGRDDTAEAIAMQVESFLRSTPVPASPHFYVEQRRGVYNVTVTAPPTDSVLPDDE